MFSGNALNIEDGEKESKKITEHMLRALMTMLAFYAHFFSQKPKTCLERLLDRLGNLVNLHIRDLTERLQKWRERRLCVATPRVN